MPTYTLTLHDEQSNLVSEEALEATDDTEALQLAEIRLLLTTDYAKVQVSRDGYVVCRFVRDSLRDAESTDVEDEAQDVP